MDGGDSSLSLQQKLQDNLSQWKCVIVHGYSLLLWERSFYPHVVVGITTLLFLMIWATQASVLTTFSLLAIVACLLDYLIPIISPKYLEPNFWKEKDSERYKKAISQMIAIIEILKGISCCILEARNNRPKVYYPAVFFSLSTFAWIANMVNNLWLSYFFVLGMLLLPGMRSHGLIDRVEQEIRKVTSKWCTSKSKTK